MQWFVIHTKPGFEVRVATALGKKDIPFFLPVFQYADPGKRRKKGAMEYLFKGCVLVRVTEANRPTVLALKGVTGFLFWRNQPAIIHDEEIFLIRMFLAEFPEFKLEKSTVAGDSMARISTIPVLDENNQPITGRKLIKLVLPSLGYTLTSEEVKATGIAGLRLGKTMKRS